MHVLFDCDGTLVDSETLALRALRRTAVDLLELEISMAQWTQHLLGYSRSHCLDMLKRWFGDELPSAFPEVLRYNTRTLLDAELTAIEGAADVLSLCPFPMSVVSNGSSDHVRFVLSRTGLLHQFQLIASAGAVALDPKPAPALYLQALRGLELSPCDCIAIEDSIPGVKSAKAAGLKTVGIAAQASVKELQQAGADLVLFSIRELPEVW